MSGSCTVVKETLEFYMESLSNPGRERNLANQSFHNSHEITADTVRGTAEIGLREGSVRQLCSPAACAVTPPAGVRQC